MRSLLIFLLRFKTLILLLILEAVALVMITSSHNYHQTVAFDAARSITGIVAKRIDKGENYFRLKKINDQLMAENLMLHRRIEQFSSLPEETIIPVTDSVSGVKYTYLNARVINNSVNKQKNFITLDKGSKQGVVNGMGVASSTGVVGIVVGVSRDFSVAMSLLNTDFRLSASIKRNNYFGSLTWDGRSYRSAWLSEIPHHVAIREGDTVVTSGYSAIFPAGLMAGTLTGDQMKGGDFISLNVLLSTDFKKLTNVYIIGNLIKNERKQLEEEAVK